jgi:hypothetical protein
MLHLFSQQNSVDITSSETNNSTTTNTNRNNATSRANVLSHLLSSLMRSDRERNSREEEDTSDEEMF